MAGSEHASAAGADERVAVTAGGVHVSKWVTEEGSTVPIVKYEVRSVRDDDVRVALTDRVPEHLELDDVGFHDEYYGDRWQHTDPHTIRFESEVPAGETLTTVYGVRREAIEEPEAFLSRPQMSISASKRQTNAAADGDSDGEVEDAASDDGVDVDDTAATDADPGDVDDTTADDEDTDDVDAVTADDEDTDDVDAGGETGESGTLSLTDPTDSDDAAAADDADGSDPNDAEVKADGADVNDGGGAGADASDGSGSESVFADGTEDATTEVASSGSSDVVASAEAMPDAVLVERFVEALESGDVPAETKAALGRELNLQLSASSSQFVEHLQSRMKDKRSQFADDFEGLEDSVAELYGVKADASTVAEMRDEMATEVRVDDLADAVDDLGASKADETALAAVQDSLVDLEGKASTKVALEAEASALASEIETVEADLHALDERAASESDLDALADSVEELDEATPTLEEFESLREDVEALSDAAAREDELDAVADDLATAREEFESELGDLEDAFDDRLEEEVAALDAELASLDDAKAAATDLEAEHERVETLSRTKADAERLGDVEAALEERYVTVADVTDVLEARLERSLFARTVLVVGGALAGAGIALAATGVTAGVALLVAGVAAIGYWWYLNEKELVEHANPGALASNERDADADVSDDEPAE